MASRLRRDSSLETRTARLKRPPRGKPYAGPSLARGLRQDYRRNRTGNGSWIARGANGRGAYWTKVVAEADDFDDSNGRTILSYHEAQDAIRKFARGEDGSTAPVSVDGALTAYEADLKTRQCNPYNGIWPRKHLTGALLAKPVALLDSTELIKWRNGLLEKIGPATINRLCRCLAAALNLAALHDKRIKNAKAWEVGLAGLPDAAVARNIVLSDNEVRAFVAEAYSIEPKFGLFADVLAVTGTRPSQAVRLLVDDLHDDPLRPTLEMPRSGKGGTRNRAARKCERITVPITQQLAIMLKQAVKGRASDEPLLLQTNGQVWPANPCQHFHRDVSEIVTRLKLNPKATMYCLRHSSIVRMLLRNVPIRVVAATHDTSVKVIESNYSRYITKHSDDVARGALLQHEPAQTDNVIPLAS